MGRGWFVKERVLLHHHLTYIDVGAIFLAKPVYVWVIERDKGNMRSVSLVLMTITFTISCSLCGCDFITGNLSENDIETLTQEEINGLFIPLILSKFAEDYDDDEYNIIKPEMVMEFGCSWDDCHTLIEQQFKLQGYNFTELTRELFDVNKRPVQLNIPSSSDNGYVIDHDNTFPTYFERYNLTDAWKNIHIERPKVQCYITISQPVYDPTTGIVLVYSGWVGGPMAAMGIILAFKYDGTSLEEIAYAFGWIS
jgi:hypothetical protein